MSNVADKFDVKSVMLPWLGAMSAFYVKDLKALPEDKLFVSPGGVARAPRELTADVVGLCKFASATLRGETSDGTEGMPDMSSCDTCEKMVAIFEEATKELGEAIANAPDDGWTREIMAPWQMKDTVYGITNAAINHIWYHDGQLNCHQALLGDDKIHWMD